MAASDSRIKKSFLFLMSPNKACKNMMAKHRKTQLTVVICIYTAIGLVLDLIWPFPSFAVFLPLFVFIGALSIWAIFYFQRKMQSIITELSDQDAAKRANIFYLKHWQCSTVYIFGPITVISVFGIGGCSMFGAIKLTPTLIWILGLFFTVVYVSIVGYVLYIALAIYVYHLAAEAVAYTRLPKAYIGNIPARLGWLQNLTRLCHTYRTCFFTLGTAYIIAFFCFCWLPSMQAITSSLAFYLLWGIILLAIVIVFPLVSLLEHIWIKKIVAKLKNNYINDYVEERKLELNTYQNTLIPKYTQSAIDTIYIVQILNSSDYPLKSRLAAYYAITMAFLNFVGTFITLFEGALPILNGLLQIV